MTVLTRRFSGSFTQQEPIPDEAIEAAVEVLKGGRLHRYNTNADEASQTALLEAEFACLQGAHYCLAVASGGQAMQIALRAAGVQAGAPVLTNAYTLAPVPGAIVAVGAVPVLVEINENLRLDMDDLERKAAASGAKVLLLSHMRGHLSEMDALVDICERLGITLIEDCAHTMGARWNGTPSGNFGLAGCFSCQTYKHINSGEGGLLTSSDPDFMARAIILSGSYMLFERHDSAPDLKHFENAALDMPNMSARMDNLRAAILRPQLAMLEDNIRRWNEREAVVADVLTRSDAIHLPVRPNAEAPVRSSIQFRVPELDQGGCRSLIEHAAKRGVELKWFGADGPHGFTSTHQHWRYVAPQSLPQTDAILAPLFDMRLPLTFRLDDCRLIGELIVEAVHEVTG